MNKVLLTYLVNKYVGEENVIIQFKNKKLERLFNRRDLIEKKYGKRLAKKIEQRMYELDAAEVLNDISHLPPLRCHQLKGPRKGHFAVNVTQKLRIVFIPAHKPVPKKPDGGIDKKSITAIKIISIEDYHG